MSKNKSQDQQASFFKELGSFMKPYTSEYACSVILSVFSVGTGIGAYAFAGSAAALLFQKSNSFNKMFLLILFAVLCKLLSTVLLQFSTWISHKAAYRTLKDLRLSLEKKLLRIPMGYFEVNGSGRLKTLMVDRIENMEKTLAHMLPELTADLLCPVSCIVWMFFLDSRLALIVLGWMILGFSVTFGMMKNYDEKYARQISKLKNMNQAVVEFVNGIEVIKNFGRTDACYQKYEDAVYGHAEYNVGWQKDTQKFMSLGMAIAPFSIFPLWIGGLLFYANGSLEAGTLFLMVLLSFGIFTPLVNASGYFDQLAGMGTSAKEIKEVLDVPELRRGTLHSMESTDIEYRDVCFSYGGEKEVLHKISLNIPKDSMLALVGPSGSGKSTVAKLLAGFWDVTSGEIRIGKAPLWAYTQEFLNQNIAFVDQDTFLFDESIEDNIRIGCPDATTEEVMEAAKRAGCDEFIRKLPNAYQTPAGIAGSRLSGGEKQRIAIARAMMKNAPILILDEATASTDPENERSIQKALTEAASGKTLIVIAHRLSTIKNADQIAYVENGRICASGNHEELLHQCPAYRKMWERSEGGSHA